jgi:hypothetical protein
VVARLAATAARGDLCRAPRWQAEPGLNPQTQSDPATTGFPGRSIDRSRHRPDAGEASAARRRCPRTTGDAMTTDPEPARIAGKQEAA